MYSGKSTIASILSRELSVREIPVDYIAGYYYLKHGIVIHEIEKAQKSESFKDYIDYVRPFELRAVLNICQEFSDGIISFGAGHSYYQDDEQINQLLELKKVTPNIFLLLPSKDDQQSIDVLNERMREDRKGKMSEERLNSRMSINAGMVTAESNRKLAHHVIYTEGKTPAEVALEIKRLIK
jgi:shikimate kinase